MLDLSYQHIPLKCLEETKKKPTKLATRVRDILILFLFADHKLASYYQSYIPPKESGKHIAVPKELRYSNEPA